MTEIPEKKPRGIMVYPRSAWAKLIMKMPLYFWRMGLSPILKRWFLVLATTGRKSGKARYTMLEFSVVDGKKFISSGWSEQPDWCKNIAADPQVTVQSRFGTESAIARRVTEDEDIAKLYFIAKGKSPVWKAWLEARGIEDNVEDFVAKKDRLVTFRMEPTNEKTPAPMKADWMWVWAVVAGVIWAVWRLVA